MDLDGRLIQSNLKRKLELMMKSGWTVQDTPPFTHAELCLSLG